MAVISIEAEDAIYFWKPHESPFGIFSQWYKGAFKETRPDGIEIAYETAEQYMMRKKALLFEDQAIAEQVIRTTDPAEQRRLGRSVRNFDEKIWTNNRLKIVEEGNYLKFTQDAELKKQLLETCDMELVEASPRDRIWGVGFAAEHAPMSRDRWGQNLLGKALMSVRKRISQDEQAAS
ncbi:MAG: hypothetical protein M4579_001597 [Chaenotheca gracillima]|nr:MAG: hypothetical protein M4579_001597 [Chaenotheca gracillima]